MKRTVVFLWVFLVFTFSLFAQEGMWLFSQLDQLDLKKKGIQLETSRIYSKDKPALNQAVVQLGGGTASFVSPDGLLLTNHHVAFTALQRSSSVKSDFITNGFLAAERSQEIRAPGYQARLMTEMRDVTDEVLAAAAGITGPLERDKKINEKIASMTGSIEKDKDDVEASVVQMYNGKQYMLFVYKLFKDIRIVYAPPLSIGNYGGETDNWMWPRHTGDFSFFRVYVSKDGTGKEYSADNVPYHPPVWLKVAKGGLKDGDLTFVIGYPGFTTRYRTSTSVHWNLNYNYPFSISNYKEIIGLADEITKDDPAGKIKVASLVKGLANAMKNNQGKVDGMKKTNFLQKKIDFETDFMKWVNSDPARKAKYGNILSDEKKQYGLIEGTRERDNVLGIIQGLSGTLSGIAGQIYGIAKEMEKPEKERDPGINDRAIQQTIDGLQYAYANYHEPFDKALLLRALTIAGKLPQDQRITELDYIINDDTRSVKQFVEDAYRTSKLSDPGYAKELFKKNAGELEALNDPILSIAVKLYPLSEKVRETNELFAANVTDIRKYYLDALYEWKGKGIYPDANGTIRFTIGPVKGYRPGDAVWYYPFTSLSGVVEKNKGEEPFNAPEGLVALEKAKDFGQWANPELNDVPVAFLSQCDITGGNSGSPIMNAKGELVGVIFDGNYEAMISDWQYDFDLQRAISVDIRYVLFITEKFARAGFILKEMGL